MTDTTADLETSIKTSLTTITRHWEALLATATPSGVGHGGSRGTLITADDHADTDHDVDRATRIVSLRRFATDVLNGWSRVVMEDRPVTTALPDGSDVPRMATFLDRHAQWMSGHDAADDMAEELLDLARRVTALAAPRRPEWHVIGECPLEFFPDEGESWICQGRVRVPIGGDQSEASCSRCGTSADVSWWEDVMGKSVDDESVRATDIAIMLGQRLKLTVTERTVRNWARDERISTVHQFGPQPAKPRYWFNPRIVLGQVARMDRDCPMCGRQWSGTGEVCSRCFRSMQTARPQKARAKRATPTANRLDGWCPWPRDAVPDKHDTDRPDRCHYSDLPLDQCACGRHNREAS